jgi:hypothetical protein
MTDKPLKVIQFKKPTLESMLGRCATCQFWIDAEAMEHVGPVRDQSQYNVYSRECWAENPNTVAADRRVKTGPFDLCRHWELKRLPAQATKPGQPSDTEPTE